MRGLSGFSFLLGISVVASAVTGKWALDRSQFGGKWVALDVVLAVGCFLVSMILWNVAKRRELRRLIREHGSVGEALRHFDPSA